jgi:Na+-transporting methylmalonyl-CoA/oxaloacetate decarboxylase gamma subunit
MDPISLGLALTILGMGGTLLTLFLLSLMADLLKRLFPLAREQSPDAAAPPPASAAAAPPAGGQPPAST